jgi:hypothetical protein
MSDTSSRDEDGVIYCYVFMRLVERYENLGRGEIADVENHLKTCRDNTCHLKACECGVRLPTKP